MESKTIHVLVVEGNMASSKRIQDSLEAIPGEVFNVQCVDRLSTACDRLSESSVDVILLDLTLPDSSGLQTLMRVKTRAPTTPIVVLTGTEDATLVVSAVQSGAQNFWIKSSDDGMALQRALRYPIERKRRRRAEQSVRDSDLELQSAAEVQRRLFPNDVPSVDGLDIAGLAVPARATCGDYFDFIQNGEESIALVVGDVSGHGLGPALLMAETRAYLRAFSRIEPTPNQILKLVNEVLVEDTDDERFVTLIMAQLFPQSRMMVFANAGHQSGYVLSPSGRPRLILGSTGPPLGLFPNTVYPCGLTTLEPGELLLLITDGLVEAAREDDTMYGVDRVFETVREHRGRSAREITKRLTESVTDFTGSESPHDDITIVVAKVVGPEPGSRE